MVIKFIETRIEQSGHANTMNDGKVNRWSKYFFKTVHSESTWSLIFLRKMC